MEITFHYPHELTELLIQTVPRLCRSKKSVLLFFQGSGVSKKLMRDLIQKVELDRQSINKFEMVRTVLERLNELGERGLKERREILKRIVEFEDFSVCWPKDQLEAKGLVSQVQKVINVKDSFTRMKDEKERERKKASLEVEQKREKINEKKEKLNNIKKELYALFGNVDPWQRGKTLEKILNDLFDSFEILIKESFTLRGNEGQGIVEQIDGVIGFEGNIYFVEMKWWDCPLGVPEMSQHLVRIYHRGQARGIFISANGYTQPAIKICQEALQKTVVALCDMEEIIKILESEKDLKHYLKEKINSAVVNKNPYYKILAL